MYHEYTQEELRAYCRSCIESLEIWARRFVHEKMVEAYGPNYVEAQLPDGSPLLKREILNHISKMQAQNPGRFSRPVDTLFIDQIIYLLCKRELYLSLFKEALDFAYPQGSSEAQEFLSRLVPIRNALSHSNPISVRQAEQAVCYCHDFVEGLKEYYKSKGEEQVWNVPRIIRVTDSLGNTFENPSDTHTQCSIFSITTPMYCGDTYSVTVEVDPSFSPSSYKIFWVNNGAKDARFENKTTFSITFSTADVADWHGITCNIISNKEWHKYRFYDCSITVHLTVLPPIDNK